MYSMDKSMDKSIDKSIDKLIDKLIDRQIDKSIKIAKIDSYYIISKLVLKEIETLQNIFHTILNLFIENFFIFILFSIQLEPLHQPERLISGLVLFHRSISLILYIVGPHRISVATDTLFQQYLGGIVPCKKHLSC